jgi:hypothetical protein
MIYPDPFRLKGKAWMGREWRMGSGACMQMLFPWKQVKGRSLWEETTGNLGMKKAAWNLQNNVLL